MFVFIPVDDVKLIASLHFLSEKEAHSEEYKGGQDEHSQDADD